MKFSAQDLNWAATEGLITGEQSLKLIEALQDRYKHKPKFDLIHICYYAGALIVILAMVFYLAISWDSFGHGAMLMISIAYALGFSLVGLHLYKKPDTKVPGGLLVTVAVSMVPVIVYSIERLAGIWPQGDPGMYEGFHYSIKGSWFLMEFWTIVASIIALRFVRFPFLLAPLSFCLWYMSMDMTPLLFGLNDYSWDQRLAVSTIFGAAMLLTAYIVDLKVRSKNDYAFWLYLFGMLAFWFGLTLRYDGSEVARFGYFAINVGLMAVSVFLQRKVFIIFGALGVIGYMGHLAYEVFRNWMQFPLLMTAIGAGIIYAALKYQKHQEKIEKAAQAAIPEGLRPFIPHRA